LKFSTWLKFHTPLIVFFQFDGFGGSAGTAIKFNYNNKEIVSAGYSVFIGHFYTEYSIYQNRNYKKVQKANNHLYTGLRYINTTIGAELSRKEIKFEINPKKLELLFGINANYIFKKWKFNLKTDIGGFTSKSNVFSYKIQLLAYYTLGKSTAVRFGWTDLDLKHDDIFQNNRLIIHTHLSEPNLGIAFDF